MIVNTCKYLCNCKSGNVIVIMVGIVLNLCSNAFEVMRTSSWNELITSHPHLVAETYKALVSQVQSCFPPRKRLKLEL